MDTRKKEQVNEILPRDQVKIFIQFHMSTTKKTEEL